MLLLLGSASETNKGTSLKPDTTVVEADSLDHLQQHISTQDIVGVILRKPQPDQISAILKQYPDVTLFVPFTVPPTFRSARYGPIHLERNRLIIGSKKILCSQTEILILTLLVEAQGAVVKKTTLKTALGFKLACQTHTHTTHLSRIRKKLDEYGIKNLIVTMIGKKGGYYLNGD